ncbi:CocE/NonD family hydrolase [Hymenobacter weizhouensis]|uniref:CocE/NonD family hydrolase n=1 Tax=Hymenobacter sp. YIM 151500-1 TaxID=2987689 RepID=UPI0022272518|nr:CocE/NonD family hydrolase [Hymenobacter sp. YIM 151500-1]UYZ63299.1 CocE/NonD family hydrolase [Hymenobacter sp. YIM 151500-1]
MHVFPLRLALALALAASSAAVAQQQPVTYPLPSAADQALRTQLLEDTLYIRQHYTKTEYQIPMRDGVKLYTVVYAPYDADKVRYPILLNRTPYSVGPYGPGKYKYTLGPSSTMMREGYIFAYQDVRGRYMSEGEFVDVRPALDERQRRKTDTDEGTDTFDTIEWLLKNGPRHNGRVGQWGISYPGFYTATGLLSRHPALRAASPQAPIADWFWDDFHHNGAFFLPHAFNFYASFGLPRPKPTPTGYPAFKHGTPDGYDFFLKMGPLKNADARYYQGQVAFWKDLVAHPNYDEFWQARNLRPRLKSLHKNTAVLTVGGFNDAEDLFGALKIYESIEQQNPGLRNSLVMGPWVHGGWARGTGELVGNVEYGTSPSLYYQQEIEAPFFRTHLKEGKPAATPAPEATIFESGTNRWRTFTAWPPAESVPRTLYLQPAGGLSWDQPAAAPSGEFDQYLSDPAKPVPYTEATTTGMTKEYMTDDQRFASRRPDVLVYQTEPLAEDLTLAGPIEALLHVATTGTDADWVVKVIDVYPDDTPDNLRLNPSVKLGGYQQMVRSEVMRGRFRNSFEKPEPFVPGQVTAVPFSVPDLCHTFRKGHRLMVQVQSTWFPLVDRNPQTFVPNIFEADEKDFQAATHRVYHSSQYPSQLKVRILGQ